MPVLRCEVATTPSAIARVCAYACARVPYRVRGARGAARAGGYYSNTGEASGAETAGEQSSGYVQCTAPACVRCVASAAVRRTDWASGAQPTRHARLAHCARVGRSARRGR